MLAKRLSEKLEERTLQGTKRRLRKVPDNCTDFSSNDYLGLIQGGKLDQKISSLLRESPSLSGSGGSRLISGETAVVTEFEEYLKEFYQVEAALTFTSGYDANLALIGALGALDDTVFLYDELIHASMRDAFRLSRAKAHHFKHNDLKDLTKLLKRVEKRPIVFVESVYSMDGDSPELLELVKLVKQHGGEVIVDEAHSSGVYGEKGEGLVHQLGLTEEVFCRVHTWGKAHGVQGAVVCGTELLKEYLVNFARPFIYTTGISSLLLLGARASYEVVSEAKEERAKLNENIELFCSLARSSESGFSAHNSPIQTLSLTDTGEVTSPERLTRFARIFEENHLYVVPIFHPTVPKGEERIRISLHAFNSHEEIRSLFTSISEIVRG